jgi:hypothetical protein
MRSEARNYLLAAAAVLAFGVVLLVAFDPGVELVDANELVQRQDDARAFLIADYFFMALYGTLLPLTMWRFGRPARWVKVAALLLVAASLIDVVENTLLLTSTGSVSEGRVDAAHIAGIVNIVLFTAGALPGLVLIPRAIRELRRS